MRVFGLSFFSLQALMRYQVLSLRDQVQGTRDQRTIIEYRHLLGLEYPWYSPVSANAHAFFESLAASTFSVLIQASLLNQFLDDEYMRNDSSFVHVPLS